MITLDIRLPAKMVCVVSAARSGSSMMCHALHVGGIPWLSDDGFTPSRWNPDGFYEHMDAPDLIRSHALQPVGLKMSFRNFPTMAESMVNFNQPFPYLVVMERDPKEQRESWLAMMSAEDRPQHPRRHVTPGQVPRCPDFEQLRKDVDSALVRYNLSYLRVPYHGVRDDPPNWFSRVIEYIDADLDYEAMCAVPKQERCHYDFREEG